MWSFHMCSVIRRFGVLGFLDFLRVVGCEAKMLEMPRKVFHSIKQDLW